MQQKRITLADASPAFRSDPHHLIDSALSAVRDHFDMPIAYLSEFVGDGLIFRHVSAPGLEDLIRVGDRRSLDECYCGHILNGNLPQLIPDTSALPLAQSLPITHEAPIGSHVSLPINRADGTPFGMFCCLSPVPNRNLNVRDMKVMRLFANLAAEQLHRQQEEDEGLSRTRDAIGAILRDRAYDIVYQPIYSLADGRLASFESLCRFRPLPYRTPDAWFADAQRVGLQEQLEVEVIEKALTALRSLPPDTRLAINAAPDTVANGALWPVLARHDPNRITLEITEHTQSSDFPALQRAIQRAVAQGVWLAIDDVGSGYSGLQQILRLKPHILKLDMSLVRDIDSDLARRSLSNALVHFGAETGARITAEGVETTAEWSTLRAIGVTYAQGWLMGRPAPLASAQLSYCPDRPNGP